MLLQLSPELLKEAIKINNDNAAGVLVVCLLTFISVLCAAIVWLQLSLIKAKDKHVASNIDLMNSYKEVVNHQSNSNEKLTIGIDKHTQAVEMMQQVLNRAIDYKLRV